MQNLKTILVLLAVVISTSVFAQRGGGRSQGPQIPDAEQIEVMVNDLTTKLLLSDEQKEQITELYTTHFEQIEAKMSSGSRPDRSEMESLKEDFEDDVKNVLNDDQIEKFEDYLKEQSSNRGQKPERR